MNEQKKLRFVIADDHSIVRRGLKEILLDEFPDSTVEEAPDGKSLLRLMRAASFDVIVCDVSMPDQSGLDVLKQIKSEFPATPVLMLSIFPEDQYALRVLRAGASGYMTKESAPEELVKAVRQLLAGRRYISAATAEKLADILDQNPSRALHEQLSDREFDVLKLIASGKTVSEIAAILSLSVTTVSTYRARLLEKMKLGNNAELTQYAIQNKLI